MTEEGTLDAGDVLPGFTLSVREGFEESECSPVLSQAWTSIWKPTGATCIHG